MHQKIAVIGGDGIGTEVVRVGVSVLERLKALRGWDLELKSFDLGADRYLRDGTTFPAEVAREIREECSAVLLGALGDPRRRFDDARRLRVRTRHWAKLIWPRPLLQRTPGHVPLRSPDAAQRSQGKRL